VEILFLTVLMILMLDLQKEYNVNIISESMERGPLNLLVIFILIVKVKDGN